MKIAVFVFSKNGYKLNMDIKSLFLRDKENEYRCVVKTKGLSQSEIAKIKDAQGKNQTDDQMNQQSYHQIKNGMDEQLNGTSADGMKVDEVVFLSEDESIKDYVEKAFFESDALIFISSTGIAVRLIAPYISHKSNDPAVLVFDETGKFCISLLSGHLGGANELCENLSLHLGVTPVITTASDLHHKVALDMFAKKNELAMDNFMLAKDLTADLLNGETIYVSYDQCLEKELGFDTSKYENILLPDGYQWATEEKPCTVYITQKSGIDKSKFLQLIPQNIRIGIGCRKDTPAEKIAHAIQESVNKHHIHPLSIKGLHSIDLKKDEPGILYFCEKNKLSFSTFSKEELSRVEGNFSASEFVSEITGVDNVCERAAVILGGRLIVKKEVYDGVTIAMSMEKS